MSILIFLRFFVFELRARTGQTETDGRTDERARRVMWRIGRLRNQIHV